MTSNQIEELSSDWFTWLTLLKLEVATWKSTVEWPENKTGMELKNGLGMRLEWSWNETIS